MTFRTYPRMSWPLNRCGVVTPAWFLMGLILILLTLSGCSKREDFQPLSKSANPETPNAESKSETKTNSESSVNEPADSPNEPIKSNSVASGVASGTASDKPGKSKPAVNEAEAPANQPAVNNPVFHDALVTAVNDYLQYSMVNSVAFEAPAQCAAPTNDSPPRLSASEDDQTHGRKLYYLFAKDVTHYLSPNEKPAPVGQVLVKESWTSKPSNPEARNKRTHAAGVRINPRAKVGDKVFEIGQRTNLFVMLKMDPDTADTDQGWVYGVVDADSKQVSAAGKVASCMQCHQDTPNDRLFGPAIDDL